MPPTDGPDQAFIDTQPSGFYCRMCGDKWDMRTERCELCRSRGWIGNRAFVDEFHDALSEALKSNPSLFIGLVDPATIHRDVSAAIDHHERLGRAIANDVINPFRPKES